MKKEAKMDRLIRDIVKECFQVGFWLGKAGAGEHSDAFYRQKDLAIGNCVERLQALMDKEDKPS